MPKIDIETAPERRGTRYPKPYDTPCLDRVRKQLGDAGGLSQFGVNLLTLMPGVWSAQRHWHVEEDEFIFVVSGEVVLVTDAGEEVLKAGDCVGFPANDGNGHHLVNRSDALATGLEVGTRTPDDADTVYYPDADLIWDGAKGSYPHRTGELYPAK
jgi:uncharacterized cupin superfamily protein